MILLTFVDIEQIGARRGAEPMPVQTPFAAGGRPPVDREQAQNLCPVGAFATASQQRGKEGVELEFAPELIAQPAGTPGAGELQLIQAHKNRRQATGGEAILGKRAHWRDSPCCSSKTAMDFCQAARWESLISPR